MGKNLIEEKYYENIGSIFELFQNEEGPPENDIKGEYHKGKDRWI